jgi:hypothetical protein
MREMRLWHKLLGGKSQTIIPFAAPRYICKDKIMIKFIATGEKVLHQSEVVHNKGQIVGPFISKTSRHLTSKLIKDFHENHTMDREQEFMGGGGTMDEMLLIIWHVTNMPSKYFI